MYSFSRPLQENALEQNDLTSPLYRARVALRHETEQERLGKLVTHILPIIANPSPFDISIMLAIFDKREQVIQRTFPLRNLTAQTDGEQIAEATALMAEVAAELHYITGFGIDKGTVKLNGKKVHKVVYGEYAPHANAGHFRYGVRIGFNPTRSYQWVNGRRQNWRIVAARFSEEWQRQICEQYKAASFRLPCLVAFNAQQRYEHFFYFGGYSKRGRKVTGWVCHLDRQDEVFTRFINRFYDQGNLALGQERYWGQAGRRMV